MFIAIALATATSLASAGPQPDTWPGAAPAIIPQPASVQKAGEIPFHLAVGTTIALRNGAPMALLDQAIRAIRVTTGMDLVVNPTGEGSITLGLDSSIGKGLPDWQADEAYRMVVSAGGKSLDITARAPHGIFNGIQTLAQLAVKETDDEWRVAPVKIDDWPRFQWRGYLLDTARHFRQKAEVLRVVDLMAFHKLNVLHLHLTDDQGWRIEIKSYPKLTTTGAEMPDYTGDTGPGRFYSQSDIKDIVAYASDRFVTVVPEIDMPGHSIAATTAYPELSCDGKPESQLCVTKDATFKFVTQVLDEVTALFPGPYIHLGGDEVKPDKWLACPDCGKRIKELASHPLPAGVKRYKVEVSPGHGLPFNQAVSDLEGEFMRRVDRYLAGKGKRMIGWDEILDAGLESGSKAVIAAWRSPSAVAGAIEQNRDVVYALCPSLYLDTETSLPDVYAIEPGRSDLPDASQVHLLGVEASMWGEATVTEGDVDHNTWPRLCALAEIAWTPRAQRDYGDFLVRLSPHSVRMRCFGIVFGIPIGRD